MFLDMDEQEKMFQLVYKFNGAPKRLYVVGFNFENNCSSLKFKMNDVIECIK